MYRDGEYSRSCRDPAQSGRGSNRWGAAGVGGHASASALEGILRRLVSPELLRRLLIGAGLTHAQLASLAGCSPARIGQLARGEKPRIADPTADRVVQVLQKRLREAADEAPGLFGMPEPVHDRDAFSSRAEFPEHST